MIWTCQLPLDPPGKGNAHAIGRNGKIYSGRGVGEFKKNAIMMIRTDSLPAFALNAKLKLDVRIRYPNYKRDLDIELIADVLQLAGVVHNDRQFRIKHAESEDEVGEPMIWITITEVGVLPWKPKVGKR